MNRPRRRGVLLWAPNDVARVRYTVGEGAAARDLYFHCTLVSQLAPESTQVTEGIFLANPEWRVLWHGHAERKGRVKQTSLRRVEAPPPADETDDGWESWMEEEEEEEEEKEEEQGGEEEEEQQQQESSLDAARRLASKKGLPPGWEAYDKQGNGHYRVVDPDGARYKTLGAAKEAAAGAAGDSGAPSGDEDSDDADEADTVQRKRRRVVLSDDEDDDTFAPAAAAPRPAGKATVKPAAPPLVTDMTGRGRGRGASAYASSGERAHWVSSGEGARALWSSSGEGARGGVGAYADRSLSGAGARSGGSSSGPVPAASVSHLVSNTMGPKRREAKRSLASLIGGETDAAEALAEKLEAAVYAQACASGTAYVNYPMYCGRVMNALRGGTKFYGESWAVRAQLLEGRRDPSEFVRQVVHQGTIRPSVARAPTGGAASRAPLGGSATQPLLPPPSRSSSLSRTGAARVGVVGASVCEPALPPAPAEALIAPIGSFDEDEEKEVELPAVPTFEEFLDQGLGGEAGSGGGGGEAFGRALMVDELDQVNRDHDELDELQRPFVFDDDDGCDDGGGGGGKDTDGAGGAFALEACDPAKPELAREVDLHDTASGGDAVDGDEEDIPYLAALLRQKRDDEAEASEPAPGAAVAVAPGAEARAPQPSTALPLEGSVVIVALDEALVLQPPTRAYPLCEAYVRERRASTGVIVTDAEGFNIVVRDGAGAFLRALAAAGARVVGATARARTWPARALANLSGDTVWAELEVRGLPAAAPSGAPTWPARTLAAASDAALRALADAGARDEGARGAAVVLVHASHLAVAPDVSLPRVPLEPWDEQALERDAAPAAGAPAVPRAPRFDDAFQAILRLAPRLKAENARNHSTEKALAREHAAAVGDISRKCADEQLREIWWQQSFHGAGRQAARLWRRRALARGVAELVEHEHERGIVGLIMRRKKAGAAGDLLVRPLRAVCDGRPDWGESLRVPRAEIDCIDAWLDPHQSIGVSLNNENNEVLEDKFIVGGQANRIGVCPRMRLVRIGWRKSDGGAASVEVPCSVSADVVSAISTARDRLVPKVLMRWAALDAALDNAAFAKALAAPAVPFSHVCSICAAHGLWHTKFKDLSSLEQHMKDAAVQYAEACAAPPQPQYAPPQYGAAPALPQNHAVPQQYAAPPQYAAPLAMSPQLLAPIYAMDAAPDIRAVRGRGRGRGGRGRGRGRGNSGSPGGATAHLGNNANDWQCLNCPCVNFAWRHECFRCRTPRAGMWPAERANHGRGFKPTMNPLIRT